MRILFIAPRFHTNQYQLVKTLLENNHEVFFHVAYLGPTEDHRLVKPVNFEQSRVSKLIEKVFGKGGVKKPFYFPNLISYWKNFRKLEPEIIIIRDPYKNFFSIIAAFFANFKNTKVIFYTQEELYRPRTIFTLLKQKLAISFFKAAWMTPIIGDQEGKNAKPANMYYVPLPIPLKPSYQIVKRRFDDLPKILMIGKYHQDRKKHLLLVEAISQLKSKYKFAVTFVGECVTEDQEKRFRIIEEAVYKKGLANVIHLKKNIPFDKMEELYTSHDIFVLPAIDEQYGVSTTEALGFGLPVICTDTCGARFNIKNGENGYVVKSNSLEELRVALETLISDKERILQMSEKSFEYVQKNLSGSAFYEKFAYLTKDRFQLPLFNQRIPLGSRSTSKAASL